MIPTNLAPHRALAVQHRDPDEVDLNTLVTRIEELEHFAAPSATYGEAMSKHHDDPRCGCEADDEGSQCDWDDLGVLEHVYAHRMAEAA